jgi:hypothetical protein
MGSDGNFPQDLFNTSEVDVKIVNGRYVPCKICHWYNQCVIPKRGSLNWSQSFHQHDTQRSFTANATGRAVYKCIDFTILK